MPDESQAVSSKIVQSGEISFAGNREKWANGPKRISLGFGPAAAFLNGTLWNFFVLNDL
jgi:hypothetical protein